MKLNQPITSTDNNYGVTCLIAGILQVIFGFSVTFVGLAICAVAGWSAVKSFQTEKLDQGRIAKAKIGIGLVVATIIVGFATGISGILGFFLQ